MQQAPQKFLKLETSGISYYSFDPHNEKRPKIQSRDNAK